MRALSLFTGYGGIDLALEDYVRPIMYCEIEKYCQGIILSRMDDGTLPFAPIWNDVTTLDGKKLRGLVDIIYGGFPCQDLSVAGKGAGLAGKRSGLFTEIIRLAQESSSAFIFLENVPAIRTRGSLQVQEALASIGYDTRWCTLSAAEVGAKHKRERWFCLAKRRDVSNTNSADLWKQSDRLSKCEGAAISGYNGKKEYLANTSGERLERQRQVTSRIKDKLNNISDSRWWSTEPDVGRVANGVAFRMDRIKALGNGVVPLQVKTAFEILIGI